MNPKDRPVAPPAKVGDPISEIDTPALIIDLDAFDRNVEHLRARVADHGVRLRAHAKTHKSVDIAAIQIARGGACGVCCQKVSEAEVLVAGGIADVLVSNQVIGKKRLARLVALAHDARIIACVDDAANVDELAAEAMSAGVIIEVLVEVDVGMGRCGVLPGAPVVDLAKRIVSHDALKFAGIQAYHGRAQHIVEFNQRQATIQAAIERTRETVAGLSAAGLTCAIVGGAGTGSYAFEAASGVYNELQCGSYVFMDADYRRVQDASGQGLSEFASSLFVLTSIISTAVPGRAISDAGLKAVAMDSGNPWVDGNEELSVIAVADEHTIFADPNDSMRVGDRLRLVPGHCDPTCNLYDWYVGVRGDQAATVWPVSARGCLV